MVLKTPLSDVIYRVFPQFYCKMAKTTAESTSSVIFVKQMIVNKTEVVQRLHKPCGGDVFLFHDEKG